MGWTIGVALVSQENSLNNTVKANNLFKIHLYNEMRNVYFDLIPLLHLEKKSLEPPAFSLQWGSGG